MSFLSSPKAPPPPPPVAPPPMIDAAADRARVDADAFRMRRGALANVKTTGSNQVTTAAARLLGS